MRYLAAVRVGAACALLVAGLVGGEAVSAAAASPHGPPCVQHARTPQKASLIGWGSAENKSITKRIDADARRLALQGLTLTEWGPDFCSGKVKIYLAHYSQAAERILTSTYGSDIIVSHRSMPPAVWQGRSGDVSPFNGGDFILTPHGGCTGGPIAVLNNTTNNRMLSAGHCDGNNGVGDKIYRSDRNLDAGGPIMGKVEAVRLCDMCIDSEVIFPDSTGAHYQHYVWGGGDTGQTAYSEDGTAFPQPGDLVTQDSAFTGEITRLSVAAVNQTVLFDTGFHTVELTKVTSSQVICHAGDSGGPWLQHEDGTSAVKIVGTHVGGNSNTNCTTAYYEQIRGIETFFAVHIP